MDVYALLLVATGFSALCAAVCGFVAFTGAPMRVRRRADEALAATDRVATQFELFRSEVKGVLDSIEVESENVRKQRNRISGQQRRQPEAAVPQTREELVAHYRRGMTGQVGGDGLS